MSQRTYPVPETLCAACLCIRYENAVTNGPECDNCEQPYRRLELHGADDIAAVERLMRDFVGDEFGLDRVMVEEALSKLVLRAIANGAPEPDRIAASMLRILEQKAERLYG
jgi:hypothetical protein